MTTAPDRSRATAPRRFRGPRTSQSTSRFSWPVTHSRTLIVRREKRQRQQGYPACEAFAVSRFADARVCETGLSWSIALPMFVPAEQGDRGLQSGEALPFV